MEAVVFVSTLYSFFLRDAYASMRPNGVCLWLELLLLVQIIGMQSVFGFSGLKVRQQAREYLARIAVFEHRTRLAMLILVFLPLLSQEPLYTHDFAAVKMLPNKPPSHQYYHPLSF